MMAEYLLNVKKGDKILDMCAAPGGKTFNAFIDNNDEGLIVSADIHEIRAKKLSSNIEKYGFIQCGIIYVFDGTKRIAYEFIKED